METENSLTECFYNTGMAHMKIGQYRRALWCFIHSDDKDKVIAVGTACVNETQSSQKNMETATIAFTYSSKYLPDIEVFRLFATKCQNLEMYISAAWANIKIAEHYEMVDGKELLVKKFRLKAIGLSRRM